MKKRNRLILLALIVVAAVILLAALLWGHNAAKLEQPVADEEELEEELVSEPQIDPGTGMVLEEDELPVMTP